jgi:hypothetical protein
MPDLVLSKLASSVKIETVDNLLEAISGWGYASKYGHEVLLLLKNANLKQQVESQVQRTKTRQENKKRKLEVLERDGMEQDFGGPLHSGSLTPPLTLIHTRMIDPVVVTYIPHPARPQLPHPQPQPILVPHPQPQPVLVPRPRPRPRPRPQPVLVPRPYIRTDIFDSVMNSSRNM